MDRISCGAPGPAAGDRCRAGTVGTRLPLAAFRRLAAVVLLALVCAATVNTAAAQNQLFTVSGVKVDVTDTDAAKAKLKAIQEAQVKAFEILVARLGNAEDVEKVANFKPSDIGRLMASLSFEEERSGPQRYVGTLTIKFLPKRVRQALASVNFNYIEEQAPKVLIVPVWRSDQGVSLWDDNPWRTAWQSLKAENALVPILTPLGDLTDLQMLTPEEAIAQDQLKLEALGYRYGVQSVLVAIAEPTGENAVHARIHGQSPVGELEVDKSYISTEGGVEAAAKEAATRIHAIMTTNWRKSRGPGGLANTNVQVVNIAVPFSSIAEWNAIRGQLSITPGVQAVDVSSLSATGALVRLTYAEGFENLRFAMEQQRLSLVLVSGTWVLQPF